VPRARPTQKSWWRDAPRTASVKKVVSRADTLPFSATDGCMLACQGNVYRTLCLVFAVQSEMMAVGPWDLLVQWFLAKHHDDVTDPWH